MGVYINMEMPKACYECHMYEADIYYCAAAERDIDIPSSDEGRCSFCPLVPVPLHGRLIDADKLGFDMMDAANADQALAMVDDAPTIVEADGEER